MLDAVYTWMGPIDSMKQMIHAREVYEAAHLQLDVRRSRKMHKALMYPLEGGQIPIEEAIKVNTWAGASKASSVAEAVELVLATAENTCSEPTGPIAWTNKLWPC